MTHDNDSKTAAELQREIDMQRNRVEDTIDQIQERLSPGQMVDELLAYTKGGGGEFVSSLQRNVTANPLPVALLGVSLAWLMAKPASAGENASSNRGDAYSDTDEQNYPVAVISGTSLRRSLRKPSDPEGEHYAEFTDDAGKTFRAKSDGSGKRAGHFSDEAGNRFKGFTNAAGERIEHFRDEAGNLIEEASDWASHTWQMARERMHDARDTMGTQASMGKAQVSNASDAMLGQMENLNHTIINQFRDQPLVGGALAFALGAALGSTLPHTPQEDALMGEASEALKSNVGHTAADFYEQSKVKATELYATATEKVGQVYEQAREGATQHDTPSSASGPDRSGGTS